MATANPDTYSVVTGNTLVAGGFPESAFQLLAESLTNFNTTALFSPTNFAVVDQTTGLRPADGWAGPGGVGDPMIDWCPVGKYDPVRQLAVWCGSPNGQLGDNGASTTILIYDFQANNWYAIRNPWGWPTAHCWWNFGFGHNGYVFKGSYTQSGRPEEIFLYDLDAQAPVTSIPYPTGYTWGTLLGIEWFPTMGAQGSYVLVSGRYDLAHIYDVATAQWGTPIGIESVANGNPMVKYHPHADVVVIGVDMNKQLTILRPDGSTILTNTSFPGPYYDPDWATHYNQLASYSDNLMRFIHDDGTVYVLDCSTGVFQTPYTINADVSSTTQFVNQDCVVETPFGASLWGFYNFDAGVCRAVKLDGFVQPTWRTAIVTGQIAELVLPTKFGDIDPEDVPATNPNHPAASPYRGTLGINALMASANSAVYSNEFTCWYFGGGRAESYSNAVYELDLRNLTLSLIRNPSTSLGDVTDLGYAYDVGGDGDMRSFRTGALLKLNPDTGVMWCFGGEPASTDTGWSHRPYYYDTTTDEWVLATDTVLVGSDGLATAIYNPDTQTWLLVPNLNVGSYRVFNEADDSVVTRTGNHGDTGSKQGFYLDSGYYLICGTSLRVGTENAAATVINTTGTVPSFDFGTCGIAYDSKRNRYFFWEGGNTFHILTPPADNDYANSNWVWTQYTLDAGNTVTVTAAQANGTFDRFFYCQYTDGIFIHNEIDENLFFLALGDV